MTLSVWQLLTSTSHKLVPAQICCIPSGVRTEALISKGLWQRLFVWWLCTSLHAHHKDPSHSGCPPYHREFLIPALDGSCGINWHLADLCQSLSCCLLGLPSTVATESLSMTGDGLTTPVGLQQPLAKPTPSLPWESSLAKRSLGRCGAVLLQPRQESPSSSSVAAWIPWGGFASSLDGASGS